MKMETPKMDVVRFDEADVIAASSTPLFVTLSNLGNKDFSDNKASGKSASGSNFELEFSDMQGGALAQLLNLESNFNNGTSTSSLKNLVDNTSKDDDAAYGAYNGNYVWTDGEYLRQQQ